MMLDAVTWALARNGTKLNQILCSLFSVICAYLVLRRLPEMDSVTNLVWN